jgi:hypothetical protein
MNNDMNLSHLNCKIFITLLDGLRTVTDLAD